MRGFGLLFIFVILPFLAALGHDCYLFYLNHETHGFKFASFGFIWTNYALESYKQTVTALDPETWRMIDGFLKYEATVVTGGFMVLVFGLLFLARALGLTKDDSGAVHAPSRSRLDKVLNKGKPGNTKFKYNRK
jgi:hypothetical protein